MIPTNQTTTIQGPGSLLVRAFRYVLNYPLIESFDFRLVESDLVKSQYFDILVPRFLLKYFSSFKFRISNKFAKCGKMYGKDIPVSLRCSGQGVLDSG